MATGTYADFKIYEPEFYSGRAERVAQVIRGFNEASRGCIRLDTRMIKGHYEKESFFPRPANLVTRRDISLTSAATPIKLTQDETIGVKVNRKIGPIENTIDGWRKLGKDQREMSFVLGQMVGEEQLKDMINTALLAVEGWLTGQTNLNFDATGQSTKTITHAHLNSALAKRGDKSSEINMLVMHSKVWFDLIGQAIADNVFEVAGATINQARPGTFNRPVLVIDSPALTDANGSLTDTYNTLGLVPGAVTITQSEQEQLVTEVVTLKENLTLVVQGEYAFNIDCLGAKWDTQNGGVNPTDAAVGTSTNWDSVAGDDKLKSGVRLKTQ